MKALLISCYEFHYDLRFKYVENILKNRGFQVKKVFSDFNHLNKQRISKEVPGTIMIKVPAYQKNISIGRLYSHAVFSYRLRAVLKSEKPSLIFADIPPNAIAVTVASYKRRNEKCKVIFDIFDLWPESFSEFNFLKIHLGFWKRIRTRALQKADYITLVCEYYQSFLEKSLRLKQYSMLYLCKPTPIEPLQFSHEGGSLNFCYLGSINNIIDISAVIKVLNYINHRRRVKLYIVGDGEKREMFLEQLRQNEIDVHYVGLTFDEKVKNEIFRQCHFGINMYKEDVVVGLTMKSIDYFRVGLPTLNMNIHDTGILVEKYQSGYKLSTESLEKTLDAIVGLDEKEWRVLHENTVRMFNELFSEDVFEEKFGKVLDIVEG